MGQRGQCAGGAAAGRVGRAVAYLSVVLPRLERRLGRPWLAATVVVLVWAGEHAFYPLLVSGGGLDLGFAAYRVGPVCRSWPPGLAPGTRWVGGRCRPWSPEVLPGGTALALALGLVG